MSLLEHFHLDEHPFVLTPNSKYFCKHKRSKSIFDAFHYHLRSGEGFIKVVGEVGTGKTMLCREILNSLDSANFITCFIPNPNLDKNSLLKSLASELSIAFHKDASQFEIVDSIYEKLIQYHMCGKRVILIVDEAQALSDEGLETLRLLTNLETETHKLLQILLFGQPELDDRLKNQHLRQVQQRITFSFYLDFLTYSEMEEYIRDRLKVAGHKKGNLFTQDALKYIYQASQGVPRIINILAYKSMIAAHNSDQVGITKESVKQAITDSKNIIRTQEITENSTNKNIQYALIGLGISSTLIIGYLLMLDVLKLGA